MAQIWNKHFIFFRRYGLADRRIVFLNGLMLLSILFVAYPLRFIFESLFAYGFQIGFGNSERMLSLGITSFRDAAFITGYFAIGLAFIQTLFSLMYVHAYNARGALGLNSIEITLTRKETWLSLCEVVIAVVVAVAAFLTPLGPFAGFFLFLNLLLDPKMNWFFKRSIKAH